MSNLSDTMLTQRRRSLKRVPALRTPVFILLILLLPSSQHIVLFKGAWQ